MALTRQAIREAVDVQRVIDRLVDSGAPLDAHPLQDRGDEIQWLEDVLAHMTMRWVRRRGVKVE